MTPAKRSKRGEKEKTPHAIHIYPEQTFLHTPTASVPLDSPQSEISTDPPAAYPRFSSPSSVVQRFMPNSEQQAPVVFLTSKAAPTTFSARS